MAESLFDIQSFIHELSDIPLSDMLCDLDTERNKILELTSLPSEKQVFEIDGSIRVILKQAQEFRKEADLNSLCAVHMLVEWKIDNKSLRTPLFLFPLDWSVNKQHNQLQVQSDEEFELNPFVKHILRNWTNHNSEFEAQSVEETLTEIQALVEQHHLELRIIDQTYLGNFHYHRFHILRELEGIERSNDDSTLLNTLLGLKENTVEKLDLPGNLLTVADTDQQNVFKTFAIENVVVQGPPGTGKSQVLVNLLGKLMSTQKRTLVVSEKKVALEVITSKLMDLKLNPFAFVVHSQTKSRDLLEHLKATWLMLENGEPSFKAGLQLSEQRLAQLQLLLDRLNSSELVGGVSYSEFLELKKETPIDDFRFRSDTPDIKEWLKHKNSVQSLDIAIGGLNKLTGFKPSFFQLSNGDQKLKYWLELLTLLTNELSLKSFQDLKSLFESLGRCQLIENEKYKIYTSLIEKPKEWKKFERNRLRFTEVCNELELLKEEEELWLKMPSMSEIATFESARRIFAKLRIKRTLKTYLKTKSVNLEHAIQHWKKLLKLKEMQYQLESFFLEIGLQPTVIELELGASFAKSISEESKDRLAEIAGWSIEKRRHILKFQSQIESLYKDLERYLLLGNVANLEAEVFRLSQNFGELLPYSSKLQTLPLSILTLFEEAGNWHNLQSIILLSNWRKTEALFPELIKFDGEQLLSKIEHCIAEQDRDLQTFAEELIHLQFNKFRKNNELLLKPSQKCGVEERELRIQLKRGKALLVKEFGKSRSHISIRELLDSEARYWIQDLLPIWLATPTQVADHFPLKTGLFDVVVFDEASQIPLPNAFGALYRSKRALIAGDEQQMSPTSYFGKKWSGHDLLHQAMYYYKRVALRHHYRSEYVDLIAFSNKHFYNNELLVYPSAERKQVLFSHFIENGEFTDRKNQNEAEGIANYLKKIDWSKRVGIVCFSEEQLKTVWNVCDSKTQDLITDGQEKNTVFFKPLEQVQGDEADILVISMGYAKNAEGEFHLRFGPLNQSNGYKRLNVLLTRATQEIHFFHSVKAQDFGISANESVDLLRRFLIDLELGETVSQLTFPHFLEPRILEKNELHFENITSKISNATELTTLFRVLKSRGWNPSIIN